MCSGFVQSLRTTGQRRRGAAEQGRDWGEPTEEKKKCLLQPQGYSLVLRAQTGPAGKALIVLN